jgi:hypothetical protein
VIFSNPFLSEDRLWDEWKFFFGRPQNHLSNEGWLLSLN